MRTAPQSPADDAAVRAAESEAAAAEVRRVLGDVLRHGGDAQRFHAARALGAIGAADAEPLIAALGDPDEDVRAEAAEALGVSGDPGAVPALIDSLRDDPCGAVKVNAVVALGRLDDRAAVPLLRRLIRARDDAVAWDDAGEFSDGWDDWLDVQVKAIEAISALEAGDAVDDIVAAMTDEMGQELGATVVKALARLGDGGVAAIRTLLGRSDPPTRARAAAELAGIESVAARDALAAALDDTSAEVRLTAVDALGRHDPSDCRVLARFDDRAGVVRAAVVRRCGARLPRMLNPLLDDPDDDVQIAVVAVLADRPDLAHPDDLVARLRVKLRGPSERVAVAVAPALAVLAPGVAGADLDEQLHDPVCPTALRRAAAQALGGLADDRALDALVRAVGADDREVRLTAMIAIGQIAASDRAAAGRARDALVATLRGHIVAAPEPADAVAPPAGPAADDADEGAATTSGGAEPEAADAPDAPAAWPTSTLEAILGDDGRSRPAQDDAVALSPDELDLLSLAGGAVGKRRVSPTSTVAKHLDVRHFAARLLADLAGDDGVAGALAAALDDRDVDTRRAAADSLARLARLPAGLGVASVAALTAALADADRDVRLAAVRAVGLAGGRETEAALAACLDDVDRAVRAQAVRSLGRLCDDDRDIRARLDDDDPAIRLAAATALAARSPPDTVDRLCDFAMAFEGYQRLEAARLARPIDAAAASRRFLAVLRDPADRRGWLIAVEALTELHRRPGTG